MSKNPVVVFSFILACALISGLLVYREVPFVKDALTGDVGEGCAGVFALDGAVSGRYCFNGPGILRTESGFFLHYSFGPGGQLFGYGAGELPQKTEEVPLRIVLLRPPGQSAWACAGQGTLRKEGEDIAFNGALQLQSPAWLEPARSSVAGQEKSQQLLINGSDNEIGEIFGHGCDQATRRCEVDLGPENAPTRVFVRARSSLQERAALAEAIVLTENARVPDQVTLRVTTQPESHARFPRPTGGGRIQISLTGLSEPVVCPGGAQPGAESIALRWRRWGR